MKIPKNYLNSFITLVKLKIKYHFILFIKRRRSKVEKLLITNEFYDKKNLFTYKFPKNENKFSMILFLKYF